jgi:hypothetical protein
MQMALEALTNCTSEYGHRCTRCDSEVDEGGKVASALRTALAQPESVQHCEIERLRAERDALLADAGRYRWLRSARGENFWHCHEKDGYGGQILMYGVDLDAAIDENTGDPRIDEAVDELRRLHEKCEALTKTAIPSVCGSTNSPGATVFRPAASQLQGVVHERKQME